MTASDLPLLCRSPLWPGESLPSLLARLTEANRYDHSPQQVVTLCRERLPEPDTVMHPTRTATYRILANLLKLEAEELYAACAHRFACLLNPPTEVTQFVQLPAGQTKPLLSQRFLQEQLWPATNVQFCPLCLRRAAYHRVTWLPLASAVCLQHLCLLVRRCPVCQASLNVAALLKTQCSRCGLELTTVPVTYVAADPFGLFSQQIIQSWLGLCPPPDVPAAYTLPAQPPPILYRFFDGLRRAMMKLEGHWPYLHQLPGEVGSLFGPCPVKRDISPAQAYLLYATAFKGLLNWPQGFYDFLEAYRQRDGQTNQDPLLHSLGGLYYVWLQQQWSSPAFQFVQDAFDQYVLDNYTLICSLVGLNRIQANPQLRTRFPYLTLVEAAQHLSTTTDMVIRLMHANFLVSYQQVEREALPQRFRLVSRASVLALQHQWRGFIPLKAAAQLLGTSEKMTLELIEEGILETRHPLNPECTPTWTLSYQVLTDFITRLQRRISRQRPISTGNTFAIGLTSATQMLAPYGFNGATVIKFVLTGELRGHWPKGENRLDELEISLQDVAILIENVWTNQSRLTQRQLANMMYVTSAAVSTWVAVGLLCPTGRRGHTIYFDREVVFRFVEHHVFLDDAAEILGCPKFGVLKWVNSGHLHPVSGPGADSLPDYLFRRADIEQLRPEFG